MTKNSHGRRPFCETWPNTILIEMRHFIWEFVNSEHRMSDEKRKKYTQKAWKVGASGKVESNTQEDSTGCELKPPHLSQEIISKASLSLLTQTIFPLPLSSQSAYLISNNPYMPDIKGCMVPSMHDVITFQMTSLETDDATLQDSIMT